MERPFLLGTGLGDSGVDTGPNRQDGLYGSSKQNQFMLYFNHIGAQNGFFGESGAEVCVGKIPEADQALVEANGPSPVLHRRSVPGGHVGEA